MKRGSKSARTQSSAQHFRKALNKEIENVDLNKVELKEIFEIFYILENYVSFIYDKTLPKIFTSSKGDNEIRQQILKFEFIKPLISFRETILKEFIEKLQRKEYTWW